MWLCLAQRREAELVYAVWEHECASEIQRGRWHEQLVEEELCFAAAIFDRKVTYDRDAWCVTRSSSPRPAREPGALLQCRACGCNRPRGHPRLRDLMRYRSVVPVAWAESPERYNNVTPAGTREPGALQQRHAC
eukprot:1189200-Prorocentrum_minimum.AAC.5